MEKKYLSVNSIAKTRELMILAMAEFFKNRVDFSFLGNSSKDNQVWIFDEEGENIEEVDSYPRIVLFRNSSRYQGLGGITENLEGHETLNQNFSRADVNVHNYTFAVVAQKHYVCEHLGMLVSTFVKFFAKEIILLHAEYLSFNIRHAGVSNVARQVKAEEKHPKFRCDIGFFLEDNEVVLFKTKDTGLPLNDIKININLPEMVCEV